MNTPERTPPARTGRSINWLTGIAVGCLLGVLGLKVFFDNLQDELRQKSTNEQARLFVGEEIVRGIHGIEKDIYLMAVTTNLASTRRVRQSIDGQLAKLRHDLKVLGEGGTVRREVSLNLEGRDEMIREATFVPDAQTGPYVLELIEIGPLLDQVEARTHELEALLVRGWTYQDTEDHKAFFLLHDEIDAFLKHIPPFFSRLDENANRLFFDSSARLRELETALAEQRDRLKKVEMGLVALVIVLAGLLATFFLRRIDAANRQLGQALTQMRDAKEEAERASRAKSEFVSRMSHELRTPLNAIIGFAELLGAEQLPPSQKNYVGLINSSGQHLMELINAVLDHAKIEAGGMTLEQISFNLPETIEAVRSIVLERATAKGLRFTASIDAALPARVVGDPTRLRQILINLLINAVKFTEHGSVELRAAVEDGKLTFTILDTGIGMDEDGLARLFRPFAQADETITRKYGGTGLGLLISKELVEAMDGSIEVDSAVGIGTCFWIRLPLQAAAPETDPATLPLGMGQRPADIAACVNGRVLLVDDNKVNQQLGAAMLQRLHLNFDIAENGREAVDLVEVNAYRLVLMDMEMPEMDGVSATAEIRRREAASGRERLTIIAMTANALAEDRRRCFAAGMDGFISKPISLSALENEIGRLLTATGGVGAAEPPPLPVEVPAQEALPVEALPETDRFDRDRVIDMLGDEDLFKELAGMYVADAVRYTADLEAALMAEDWKSLARCAHTLKGLFATFAQPVAEEDARQLEYAASRVEPEDCRARLPRVCQHTLALADALRAG